MNNLSMIGNLGKDPELRYTGSGMAVVNITLAVQRAFKNKQTNEYETDWFNCTAFSKTAEIISNNFQKGSKIAISGSLQNNNYTKDDGTKVYRDVIVINNITFIESKGNQPNNNSTKPKSNPKKIDDDPFESNPDTIDISDDSLPFD